jgi:hypothetical protein
MNWPGHTTGGKSWKICGSESNFFSGNIQFMAFDTIEHALDWIAQD